MKYLKKNKILLIILILASNRLAAQNTFKGKLADFQGIWGNISEDNEVTTYWVIKNDSLNEVVITNKGNIYKSKNLIGFSDYYNLESKSDDSFLLKLKKEGPFFYLISKLKNGKYGLIGYRVAEVDNNSITITGSNPVTYQRLKYLPISIKKYFVSENKIIKQISVSKTSIYSSISPLIKTKMYLLQGNKIEILAENGVWLKIRYYGKKTIEGWIKKEDVSSK